MNISIAEVSALKALITAHASEDKTLVNMLSRLDENEFTRTDDILHSYIKKNLCNDELEIDDTAALSRSDEGVFVSTWVWVGAEELKDLGLGGMLKVEEHQLPRSMIG